MKLFKNFWLAVAMSAMISLAACKNKSNRDTVNSNADTAAASTTAPVQIESDAVLKNGVRDATKDYPAVNASVDNGEITLTGSIERDKLQKLMESLNSLHPKKINNNLTIK